MKTLQRPFVNLSIGATFCLLLLSCKKEVKSVQPPGTLKVEVIGNTNISSLKAGDFLLLKLTTNLPDSVTVMPMRENRVFHQTGVNYYFKRVSPVEEFPIKAGQNTDTVLVRILEPGTFHLQFKLKNRENLVSNQVVFSAVKITAWTRHTQTNGGSLFSHSQHVLDYQFTIDNGGSTYDRYLENENFTSYTASYRNEDKTGTFKIGQELEFHNSIGYEGGDSVPFNPNENLTLVLNNGTYSITYRVPVGWKEN